MGCAGFYRFRFEGNGSIYKLSSWRLHGSQFLYAQKAGVSYVSQGFGHVAKGETPGVIKHEAGHINQHLQGYRLIPYHTAYAGTEWANDLSQLTLNYNYSPFLIRKVYGDKAFNAIAMMNAVYDPVRAWMQMQQQANYDLSNGDEKQ